MGKNHRHKKNVKAERAKTKLKDAKTKFLPKGANVTDVNFKVKAIIIKEQLKSNSIEEPTSRRNLNLHELLIRLKHHKTTVRCEGCDGLIELMNICPKEILRQNLYCLVPAVSRLFDDKEGQVRKKAVSVLEVILQKVPIEGLKSFVHTLSLFMACAMTNIDRKIKEDSLLIVDAFLKHEPKLIVDIFDTVFPNFLNLISRLRDETSMSRSLTMNIGSQMTIIKWRIEVLRRLEYILSVIIQHEEENKEVVAISHKLVHFNDAVDGHVPIYKEFGALDVNVLNKSSNPIDMSEYFDALLHLLYEILIEVLPSNSNQIFRENGVTIIQRDAATVLSYVIEIYYDLWVLMNGKNYKVNKTQVMKLFLSKDSNKLFTHLLSQFPYCQQNNGNQIATNKAITKLLNTNMDMMCIKENLSICCMFVTLYTHFPNENIKNKSNEILHYLNTSILNRHRMDSKNLGKLISILRIIFFDNMKIWNMKNVNLNLLLDNVVNFYNKLGSNIELFKFLGNISTLNFVSPKYNEWLQNLPLLLLKPKISLDVLDVMVIVAKNNNSYFLQALSQNVSSTLGNLEKLEIAGDDVYPPVLRIMFMLDLIPMSSSACNAMQQFVVDNPGTQTSNYVNRLIQKY